VCNLQKHLSDARGRSKSTATHDVTGGNVQVTTSHWLSLSLFSQSQVRVKLCNMSTEFLVALQCCVTEMIRLRRLKLFYCVKSFVCLVKCSHMSVLCTCTVSGKKMEPLVFWA